jgi:hypothetical protein
MTLITEPVGGVSMAVATHPTCYGLHLIYLKTEVTVYIFMAGGFI